MKTTLKFIIAAVAAMIIGVSASAQVHFGLVISRLIAPIAAKHGAQSRLNTKKE